MASTDTRKTATDAALEAASVAEERQADVADAQRALDDARRNGNPAEIRLAEEKARVADARFNEASQAAEDAKAAMDDSFRESDLQRLKPAEKPTPAPLLIAAALLIPLINLIWAVALWRRGKRWDAAILIVPLPFLFAIWGTDDAMRTMAQLAYFASPVIAWLAVRRRRK